LGKRQDVLLARNGTEHQIIVWGGVTLFPAPGVLFRGQNTGKRVDLSTGTVFELTPSTADVGRAGAAFTVGGNLYSTFGYGCAGLPCKNIAKFDSQLGTWSALLSNYPGNLKDGALLEATFTPAPTGKTAFVFGGQVAGRTVHDGFLFRADTQQFTALPAVPGVLAAAATGRTTFVADTRFGLFGGFHPTIGFVDTGFVLREDGLGWDPLPPGAPSARIGASAAVIGPDIVLWGGRGENPTTHDIEHYADGKILRLAQ
jgi:hypothetical protein